TGERHMGRCRLALMAALLGLPGAPPWATTTNDVVPLLDVPGVIGQDNREINEADRYPWSAVGRLNVTLGGHCTATVIDSHRLLTAAHCLWNKRTGRWLPPCGLHFLLGYTRGEYRMHARVVRFHIPSGFVPGANENGAALSGDWAVLDLDRDVSDATSAMVLSTRVPRPGVDLMQAGYSRDHRHVLTSNTHCTVSAVGAEQRIFAHNCDATFGDSGSPLIVEMDGRHYQLGLHSAVRARGRETVGVAVAVYPAAQWLSANPYRPPEGPVESCAVDGGGSQRVSIGSLRGYERSSSSLARTFMSTVP
ncbi:MAG: trypsin-like serine peptidase, partial [Gammaproteobacteria bacterium]